MDHGTIAARRWVEICEKQGPDAAAQECWLLEDKFPDEYFHIGGVKFDYYHGATPDDGQTLVIAVSDAYASVTSRLGRDE